EVGRGGGGDDAGGVAVHVVRPQRSAGAGDEGRALAATPALGGVDRLTVEAGEEGEGGTAADRLPGRERPRGAVEGDEPAVLLPVGVGGLGGSEVEKVPAGQDVRAVG